MHFLLLSEWLHDQNLYLVRVRFDNPFMSENESFVLSSLQSLANLKDKQMLTILF